MASGLHHFRYRAVLNDGTTEKGVMTAESRAAVAAHLTSRQAMPLEISSVTSLATRYRLLPIREQAVGLRTLSTLVSSGLPLTKALAAFAELAPSAWLAGLDAVREGVRQGQTFAGALESSRVGLPTVVIGVIRAGETAGQLPAAVTAAADMTEFRANSRAALQSALAYPLILAVASLASLMLLLGVVVPRFATALADTGATLPASTQTLITLAAWIRASFVPALLASAVTLAGWRAWIEMPGGRLRWDKWMLSVPLSGDIRQAAATSRFCEALGTLLRSGVPVATALTSAGSALTNTYLASRLATARELVLEGAALSRSLLDSGVVTTTAARFVRAGEETGALATMLAHASQIERMRVEHLTKNTLRLVEPSLILVFGGVIAAITASLLQALYSVRPGP